MLAISVVTKLQKKKLTFSTQSHKNVKHIYATFSVVKKCRNSTSFCYSKVQKLLLFLLFKSIKHNSCFCSFIHQTAKMVFAFIVLCIKLQKQLPFPADLCIKLQKQLHISELQRATLSMFKKILNSRCLASIWQYILPTYFKQILIIKNENQFPNL